MEPFSLFVDKNKKGLVRLSSPEMAYAYFPSRRLNLLNGIWENYSFEKFHEEIEHIDLNRNDLNKRVIHFFYESGVYFVRPNYQISEETLLVIDIKYTVKNYIKAFAKGKKRQKWKEKNVFTFSDYKKQFDKTNTHLKDGNCYQLNLTHNFLFDLKTDDGIQRLYDNFLSLKEKWGAFAHLTSVPHLQKVFISNSPECLWKIRRENTKNFIFTMPIKGSMKLEDEGVQAKKNAWNTLINDKKNQAELFMITDLLRNDLLSSVELKFRPVVEVKKKKAPLKVPGLLHQYSLIELSMPSPYTLYSVMKSLFPGGSITGAPKKRVMELINSIEKKPRGFYCGSTILIDGKIKAASINIRSATIDTKEKLMNYGAGGGVTVLSQAREEFEEMRQKLNSFLLLF